MARRHLERAGPEVTLYALVGDYRHASLDNGHDHLAPDQIAITVVVRVHGDGDIGKDRRRTHRRDRHVTVAVGERIADVGERVVDVDVCKPGVGPGGQLGRTAVDDAVRAVA